MIALAPGWFVSRSFSSAQRHLGRKIGMDAVGRHAPAKSKDEDLELTRDVIMKHITQMDDSTVVDDSDDEDEKFTLESSREEKNGSEIQSEGEDGDAFGTLKNLGRKIRNKFMRGN